jgi:hypothetical protein
MKEGGGNDNLAIAWNSTFQPRVVIPAKFSTTSLSFIWSSNLPRYGAIMDTWTGIGGKTIADLMTGTNNLADTPDKSEFLVSVLEAPNSAGDNYGTRMSGWLVPPETGPYEFWIASDDHGEFCLSTDSNPANKVCRCSQPDWVSPRGWDQYPEQRSSPISLVAGQAYFYEVSVCVDSYLSAQHIS